MIPLLAAVAIAIVLLLRRTSINVIIRKDPDMATIKQRLALVEADNTALKEQLAAVTAQLDEHQATLTSVPTTDAVTALGSRVDAIEADIGTDAEPAAEMQLAPQPEPLPLSSDTIVTG